MKKHVFILIAIFVFSPGLLFAQQKKVAKKKATVTYPSYPARDDVFGKEVKFRPQGDFNPDHLEFKYTVLPAPAWNSHMLKRNVNRKQVTLRQTFAKSDDSYSEEYLVDQYDLTPKEFRYGQTPMNTFGLRFRYTTGGYHVLTMGTTYGNTTKMVITDEDEKQVLAAYDFENYRFSPKTTLMGNNQSIQDVVIEGNILYESHGINTYSESTGYQTGYITAIDLNTDEIIWTTRPMTCNSAFAILGNSIICGYGMTSEPDYLYVVDKYSGQRVSRLPLKTMAEYVFVKGKTVYVHCYNYNCIFSSQ